MKKTLNGAIQTLNLTKDELELVPKKRTTRGLKRILVTFEEQVGEVHKLKITITRIYVEEEKDLEEIRKWKKSVDDKLEPFEPVIEELENSIKELQNQELKAAKEKEAQMEQEIRQRQHEEEIKREKAILQLKQNFEKKSDTGKQKPESTTVSKAKLLKLVITKFQGTHIDWQRFWNQFEAEIDLKELLVHSVRVTNDGLPFSSVICHLPRRQNNCKYILLSISMINHIYFYFKFQYVLLIIRTISLNYQPYNLPHEFNILPLQCYISIIAILFYPEALHRSK